MADSYEQMQQFLRGIERYQQMEQSSLHFMEQAAEAARKAFQVGKGPDVEEALQRFQQQERSLFHIVEQIAEAARIAYAPLEASIRVIEKQQEAWSETIRETFGELPKQMRKVMEYLSKRGWYVGPDMTLPGTKHLAKLVDQGEHEKIEVEMQGWAESRIEDILAKIKQNFGSRLGIITDAVEAHKGGKYSLSVPVLLAQADGIAYESIHTFLFMGNPRKKFEKFLSTLGPLGPESTLEILVSPLRPCKPSGKKAKMLFSGTNKGHANRHKILHGMDTDYATKANSLRALLLVDYLLGIKEMLDSHKEWAEKWRKEFEEIVRGAEEPGESGGKGKTKHP